MAHELGHVAGLDHEHQRTDARAHFHFDCSQIHGYAEVKAAIDEKQKDLGYRNGDTIERVCEDSEMAKRYEDEIPEFAIAAWMPMDRSDVNGPQPKSVKTDFDSVSSLFKKKKEIGSVTDMYLSSPSTPPDHDLQLLQPKRLQTSRRQKLRFPARCYPHPNRSLCS